ncbi:hypothetical protein Mpsy_1598 [Methanolobus psychrophilus R15]|nr:hypothetical protein Mpsy_1598 [Methanolobus psychrophilus R15]
MILYNGTFPKTELSLKNHCSLSEQEFNENLDMAGPATLKL